MFQKFANKKILILGLGIEGQNSYKLLRSFFPEKEIGIADITELKNINPQLKKDLAKDKKIIYHLGAKYLKNINKYDVIIKSPGIPPSLSELLRFKKNKNRIITSQTKIFFDNIKKEKVIGVTGTKGKSTTTSLIYLTLKKAGQKAILIGNIGIPPLQGLQKSTKNSIFVFEMSSYQLDTLKISPHISILLNLYPEHLDYHGSLGNYAKAKKNVFGGQDNDDVLIINNRFLDLVPKSLKSKIYVFGLEDNIRKGCFIRNGYIYFKNNKKEEKIIKTNIVSLIGTFNLQNIMAAIIVCKILKVDNIHIRKILKSFKSLPHRLQRIGTYKSITFFDDSISTIPQATIAAINTLGEDVETLILGGYDRGLDFTSLSEKIARSKIKNIILFPTSGKRIIKSVLKNSPSIKYFFVNSMESAIDIAFKNTGKRKICLLSPASPSYGIFKNYKDRGNTFIKEIKERTQK